MDIDAVGDYRKQRELVWVQILYLFITPVLLLYYGIIPGNFRIAVLFVVCIMLYGIVRNAKWTWKDMGVTRSFMKDIIPYCLFTIAAIGFLFWLFTISDYTPMPDWGHNTKFLLLFIPISILQELALRGVLMNMLRRAFKNPVFIIFLNACIFSLIHIIYMNMTFVLPFTFMAGIGFAWLYYRYPNLILISISHTILNFMAMVLGFFVIR
jgi:membrane protease YdiL (CAAX protease family)